MKITDEGEMRKNPPKTTTATTKNKIKTKQNK